MTGQSMIDDQSWGVTTYTIIDKASNSRPVSGGAAWNGIMAGVGVSMGERVEGAAMLDIREFSQPAVDVSFSEITYSVTGDTHPPIEWNGLPIDNARIFNSNGSRGRFYGPNHEEVGGVFLKDIISGAFGASR